MKFLKHYSGFLRIPLVKQFLLKGFVMPKLTKKDLTYLRLIAEYRVLNSNQLTFLTAGTKEEERGNNPMFWQL